ncbi:hypothetical protein Afil01_01640 [Actinorhabdospora filicis]|uniref:DUF2567 domain-containing protein n=1 Tax=Actinorhabdospora filicis TaxID=1785913 RepID=A0A9W6SG24_9ACTN|nr:hypothetical protein [Actinorhabdospora filicis]GLZ75357.1 hypothetical protein Afil01_01640 [Actinorhabdospora filicis]
MTDASPAQPDSAPSPPTGPATAPWTPPPVVPAEPPRNRLADWSAAAGLVLFTAALGVPSALLWIGLAPRVELVRTANGFAYTTESPEGYIGDDGVFTFIGLGAGLIVALLAWFVLRRFRGPLQATALAVGAIACQIVAWKFGEAFGRAGFEDTLNSARPGDHVYRPPKLLMVNLDWSDAWYALRHWKLIGVWDDVQLGVLATMALAALFTYTILAGWSRYHSLNKDTEPVPAHGANGASGDAGY